MNSFCAFLFVFQFSILFVEGNPSIRDVWCNVDFNFIACYLQTFDTKLISVSIEECSVANSSTRSYSRMISPVPLEQFKNTTQPGIKLITFTNCGLTKLDSELFQHQTQLRQIWAPFEDFHCDCDMQWTFIVSDIFEWTITGSCSTPNELIGKQITDESNYFGCIQTQSFQCFNKSFICPDNSTCLNTVDSAYCECNKGYFQFENECHLDIDCTVNNGGCDQLCSNTDGSDHCACTQGYSLYGDKRSCLDVNECIEQLHDCQHTCINTNGSYGCDCRPGFNTATTGSCLDIDECLFNNGGCEQICTNTNGSFSCSCAIGYSPNMTSCIDLDECMLGTHICHDICFNTNGSYLCDCPQGLVLTATGSCVDIDECLFNNGGCDYTCTNTNGSYHCSCMPGYTLQNDGKSCQDTDECSSGGANTCQQICLNTIGSYGCDCYEGFNITTTGYCRDRDECQVDNGGCDQICFNTNGSFHCSCFQRHILKADKKSCQDICVNTNDSYICQFPNHSERTALISVIVVLLLFIFLIIVILSITIGCYKIHRCKRTKNFQMRKLDDGPEILKTSLPDPEKIEYFQTNKLDNVAKTHNSSLSDIQNYYEAIN